MKKFFLVILVLVIALCVTAVSGYNSLNAKDEGIRGSWSEVLNQYQRRADLVPNLVETVKGIAEQEKDVFQSVTEARAKVGEINVSVDGLDNAELFEQFQSAQGSLGSALSRLIAVSEAYPELKSNESFLELQAQLEGTENRIAVARKRYIDSVQGYNTTVRKFPTNFIASTFGFNRKPNFTVENEDAMAKPPTVKLSD